ncbi:MAG: hypothetical protein JW749_01610 [Sedimentisphaerales bacterium]|nr:hypothetical protein [Sedimentisphaerales bacterium]
MYMCMFEIFWAAILIPVVLTYKFKNPYLRWVFIIVPPLGLLFLINIPIDIGSFMFWMPADIIFICSICSIVLKILWALIRKMRNKPALLPPLSIRLIRPAMIILILPTVHRIVTLSRESADTFAIETASEIKKICDSNGRCPDFITGWEADKSGRICCRTIYGKYGTKYPVRYNISRDGKEFWVWVNHAFDEDFFISGGVDKSILIDANAPPSANAYID